MFTLRAFAVTGIAGAVAVGAILPAPAATQPPSSKPPAHPSPYPGGHWRPGAPRFAIAAKKNVKVTMSDGVKLTADVYYPADRRTGHRVHRRFPVLLQQTPYTTTTGTENGIKGIVDGSMLVEHGYIYVSADVRGTGRSSGSNGYFNNRNARDGVNLVHWAAKLPGSNGVVGLDGCSYLAQSQLYTAAKLGRHSPVKAMVPSCISGDVYRDTYFENGIPSIAWHGAGLASGSLLGPTTEAFLARKYADSQRGGQVAFYRHFWKVRDHIRAARAIVRTHIPALMWDGWDEPGFGAQELYAALQNAWAGRSPYRAMRPHQRVTGRYQLIVGDWGHGGGLDPAIELEWFNTWLKHRHTGLQVHTRTPMHLEQLPTDRWVNAATYPFTTHYRQFFLSTDRLRHARPKPASGDLAYGPPQDGDVLTFITRPFRHGVTVAGPMAASIVAAASTSNLELMVDVFDISPAGAASKIAHGGVVANLRHRVAARSWHDVRGRLVRPYLALVHEHAVPPDRAYRYAVPIQPAMWTLAPHHRLQIQLAAQPDPSECLSNGAKVVARVIGCLPRPAVLAGLAGGTYSIRFGGRRASTINLPLMSRHAFHPVRSGPTPTSDSVALPADWSSPR
ncbi:MAG: CocE/NonD family hydrolase [Frankiaceae bacterium]|nr:CocE/NonD family hydrolase [Frankiaceae bacterium]